MRQLESLVDVDLATRELETFLGLAPGTLDPRERLGVALPAVASENGNQTLYQVMHDLARQDGLTVGDLVRTMNGPRGHLTAVGTPGEVADLMTAWHRAGATDGFNVIFPVLPEALDRFCGQVVPILRERGVLAPAPAGTLRETFGRPGLPLPGEATGPRG